MQAMMMICNIFIDVAKKLSQSFIQFQTALILFLMRRSRGLLPIEMLLLLLLLLQPLEFLVDALLKNSSWFSPPFTLEDFVLRGS